MNSVFDFQIQPPFSADWVVPINLPYFDGHFPGQPILPAVIILDGSLNLLRLFLKNPQLQISQIKSSKFTMPVVPGVNVCLTAQESSPLHWHIEWKDKATQQSYAKIDLVLRN